MNCFSLLYSSCPFPSPIFSGQEEIKLKELSPQFLPLPKNVSQIMPGTNYDYYSSTMRFTISSPLVGTCQVLLIYFIYFTVEIVLYKPKKITSMKFIKFYLTPLLTEWALVVWAQNSWSLWVSQMLVCRFKIIWFCLPHPTTNKCAHARNWMLLHK